MPPQHERFFRDHAFHLISRYTRRVTFFESLLVLLLAAVLLLQVSRRLSVPYPTMLAAAGVAVAMIPGSPNIPIAPATALALFIAPVLVDAAYDFPWGAARKMWQPLIVYAVVAVLLTTASVAALGYLALGLPIAAAVVLGAIVAPPDAAAATAVLSSLPVSRRIDAVLKGESLFNDATALLLFSAGLTVAASGGFDVATGVEVALAAPGGVLFGLVFGQITVRVVTMLGNTVGSTLMQFISAFLCWIIAEHLHLSAVLAVVAMAMSIAASPRRQDNPRMRVHSYAVWTTVVFLLNVVAFLLMGMQAQRIVLAMTPAEFARAARFAAMVFAAIVIVRMIVAFGWRVVVVRRHHRNNGPAPISVAETVLIGWTGMRGLVTLATAFALPTAFPQRDTAVLTAFAIVLATLVFQGATLAPFIRLFGLSRADEADEEIERARASMAEAALASIDGEDGDEAEQIRKLYREIRTTAAHDDDHALDRHRTLARTAVLAQRDRLEELRTRHKIGPDAYLQLQEELDWKQLSIIADDERRLVES